MCPVMLGRIGKSHDRASIESLDGDGDSGHKYVIKQVYYPDKSCHRWGMLFA